MSLFGPASKAATIDALESSDSQSPSPSPQGFLKFYDVCERRLIHLPAGEPSIYLHNTLLRGTDTYIFCTHGGLYERRTLQSNPHLVSAPYIDIAVCRVDDANGYLAPITNAMSHINPWPFRDVLLGFTHAHRQRLRQLRGFNTTRPETLIIRFFSHMEKCLREAESHLLRLRWRELPGLKQWNSQMKRDDLGGDGDGNVNGDRKGNESGDGDGDADADDDDDGDGDHVQNDGDGDGDDGNEWQILEGRNESICVYVVLKVLSEKDADSDAAYSFAFYVDEESKCIVQLPSDICEAAYVVAVESKLSSKNKKQIQSPFGDLTHQTPALRSVVEDTQTQQQKKETRGSMVDENMKGKDDGDGMKQRETRHKGKPKATKTKKTREMNQRIVEVLHEEDVSETMQGDEAPQRCHRKGCKVDISEKMIVVCCKYKYPWFHSNTIHI